MNRGGTGFQAWLSVGWRVSRILLMILGAFTLIARVLTLTIHELNKSAANYVMLKKLPSPNGKYAIEVGYASGGGAISPYCIDSVFVEQLTPFGDVAQRERVYSALCQPDRELTATWSARGVFINSRGGGGDVDLHYKRKTDFGVSVSFEIM